MRVTLQNYITDPSLPQKDGVNLAHENISSLLRQLGCSNFSVQFHEINRLLCDKSYAKRTLSEADWVISNVGPHAHYYFYLRHELRLDFRIIRDVRTAIWSSYLLQEQLCQPFLRDTDILLVASRYTRGIYEWMFPHLRQAWTERCYPLTIGFPNRPFPRSNVKNEFRLGYVGRLSVDKNFPDLVDLVLAFHGLKERRLRLIACGDVHSASCDPAIIGRIFRKRLGHANGFTYLPPRSNGEIWELYRSFDAVVFPSTSNLETLGRVVVEASYAGVPVVCSNHAAASELVPTESLASVHYTVDRDFSAHFDHSLGSLDVVDLAQAVLNPELRVSRCHQDYQSHVGLLERLLRQPGKRGGEAHDPVVLTEQQRAFISAVELTLPPALQQDEAKDQIAEMKAWFLGLQGQHAISRSVWLKSLRRRSRFSERTLRFIERTEGTRHDYTNVGGVDIEICHVVGFFPTFRIRRFTRDDTPANPEPSHSETAGIDRE